jgi:hypothetical protein
MAVFTTELGQFNEIYVSYDKDPLTTDNTSHYFLRVIIGERMRDARMKAIEMRRGRYPYSWKIRTKGP